MASPGAGPGVLRAVGRRVERGDGVEEEAVGGDLELDEVSEAMF